eukprot:CAMPEP_0202704032 /NCGR_PEP_ID=MMETSP1385-20130828/16797_1 /ASSEMBLY_ACC=CAM_ASM_000861 /TAXON_ID=933848 /ORGANISM="Elphidium margaritaceum" /LENGTH=48 /DNA_ID= /DNA_START= /DNA_END= /DNA_ORIENTATION=
MSQLFKMPVTDKYRRPLSNASLNSYRMKPRLNDQNAISATKSVVPLIM